MGPCAPMAGTALTAGGSSCGPGVALAVRLDPVVCASCFSHVGEQAEQAGSLMSRVYALC